MSLLFALDRFEALLATLHGLRWVFGWWETGQWHELNPLCPHSDENEISLYIITTSSDIQVMRIKEVITKDKMSWYLDKFSLLVP